MKKIKKLLTIGLAGLITFGMFTGCDLIENSSNDSQSGSSSCEHTYEWVGNEGGHQKAYTCGCEYPDIVELHSDNNSDYVCDVCGWPMDGILPELFPEWYYPLIQAYEEKYPNAGKATILRYCGTYESGAIVAKLAGSDESFDCALWTETVADYDFNYSNGNRIRVLYGGEFYTLTQAYENGYLTKENIADIHIKWNGKLPELGDAYLHEFENWISNLMVDDVKEIKTTTEFIGVAPGRFKDIQRTTDKAVIADVINDYKSIIMTSVAREDAEIEGGGAFTIEFILANGDVQKIYFNNGIYDGNVTKPELSSLQYYRVANIPTLEKYSNVKNSYSFITYRSTFELFTIDDEKVGEFYGLDKFEFVERGETEIPDGETAIPPEEPTHYIVGDVGTMFICSDKVFYMENNGQRTYYELVGELHFDELDDYAYDLVAEYIFLLIDGLKMSDIEKIETVEYAGSVAPNIRKPIEYKTSTLETDIESVYNWLSTLKENVTKIPDEDAMLAGNSVTEMYVYTPNNNCFKVSDVGCNYLHFYGAYYEQESKMPEIVGEMVTYKFESYYDEAELYINDEKVKDYTFDFDKLICIEKDFETSGNPYKLVASIGSLYLYDEKHFIRNDIKYEIVGEFDFSQIFTDFPINGEKDLLYKVTIVDKYNEFYDKPTEEYFEAGTIITLHCYPIMDADLVMYINGERVGIQNAVEGADGYYIWEYSFVVPAEDITITFQMSGGM